MTRSGPLSSPPEGLDPGAAGSAAPDARANGTAAPSSFASQTDSTYAIALAGSASAAPSATSAASPSDGPAPDAGAAASAGDAGTAPDAGAAAEAGTTPGAEQRLLAWLAAPGAAAAPFETRASVAGSDPRTSGSPVSTPSRSPDGSLLGSTLPDPSQSASAALSAGGALAHLAPPSHAAASHSTATLQSPLGTPQWIDELGAQLTWMAHRGIESASLHVSPAELGPIEARIAVHGTAASVWFGAAQAGTRAALEHALPQLRQLFASQGLALADAGVFREPPRQSARQMSPPSPAAIAAVRNETSDPSASGSAARRGLLDLYA